MLVEFVGARVNAEKMELTCPTLPDQGFRRGYSQKTGSFKMQHPDGGTASIFPLNSYSMVYQYFQNLSANEKAECLWNDGKPVANFDRDDARFVLYQLDQFYVEVEYRTDFVEIVAIRAFEATDIPVKYLDQVNISGLDH